MGCYYTLYINTYGYSLFFVRFTMKRGNAGSWNSGLEKEQILQTYSAQLHLKLHGVIFRIYKKY